MPPVDDMPVAGTTTCRFPLLIAWALSMFLACPQLAWTREQPASPSEWNSLQKEVLSLVNACKFEQAAGRLSEFISKKPDFGPAYERHAWVVLTWLDLRDEFALGDVPLRLRNLPDPVSELGNIDPPSESRRIFLDDRFRERYKPPEELISVKQDVAACRRLMGKDFNDVPIESFIAEFVGNYDRAIQLIGTRCAEGTATPQEFLTFSRISRLRGNLDAALEAAEVAWKSPETQAQAASRQFRLLKQKRHAAEFAEFLDTWQKTRPNDPQLLFLRNGTTNNVEAVLNDLSRLVEQLPGEPGFHYGLATRRMQLRKDFDGSMSDLDRAIELKSRSLMPYYARSALWNRQGEMQSAINDITTAIELNPHFDKSYELRSKYFRKVGNMEAAQQDEKKKIWLSRLYELNAANKSKPDNSDAAVALAQHYARAEELSPALKTLTSFLNRSPHNVNALRNRCQILLRQGRLEPAMNDAEKIISLKPEPSSFALRGDVFVKQQNWDAAVKDYEKGNCLDNRLQQALRQRAAWHKAEGRLQQARTDLESANRVIPANFIE